ncbi:MAG: serine/threonine-protein kinase [Pirellulales bacterium]
MSNLEFEYLGPYHIQKLIGRGGMGSVYQGIHAKSGEPVAIKVIAPGIANQPRFRRRFAGEIDALKRLKHPNIVSLVGYGEEKGILFYSMEFVEGQSLHEILRGRGKLPWQDVVHVGIETTAALKHAHDIGIIHRDLKPANLMVDGNGKIKMTDFGIAKLYGSSDETMVGSVVGTADYMPPEQAEGRTVTVRSDLYSLGCVMYALLVGKSPFAGRTVPEVLYAVRYSTVPEIPGAGTDVPEELVELIYQLLDKEPSKRPPTALVVGNRLKAVQQALGGKSSITGQTKQSITPSERAPLTSTTNVGKKMTSLDMEDEVNLTKEDISDLVNKESATKRSDDTHEQPTLVASPTMLRRPVLTGKENPLDSELSSEHLSPGADTNRSQSNATNPSILTSGGPSHYTPVTESDTRSYTIASSSHEHHERWDWTQVASIVGMIVALVGSIGLLWWKLQPQSADQLYDSIMSAVDSGDDSQLLASSDHLDEFLHRFPHDERAIDVKSLKDEADLVRRVKILQRKAARSGGINELSAAEQAFLDAIMTRNDDFQLGQEKLGAMISLFSIDSNGPVETRLIELAKYAKDAGNSVNLTKDPVAKAQLEDLIRTAESAMSAENLNRFYKNTLLLYSDKPWARDQIARIRKKLETER